MTQVSGDIMVLPVRAAKADRYQATVDWLIHSRSQRVAWMLVGLLLINAFDVVLTLSAHTQGLLDEMNPIARAIMGRNPYAILPYKLALVLYPSMVLYTYRDRLVSEVAAAGVLLVYVFVALRWRVCYELYTMAASGGGTEAEIEGVCLGNIMSQYVF